MPRRGPRSALIAAVAAAALLAGCGSDSQDAQPKEASTKGKGPFAGRTEDRNVFIVLGGSAGKVRAYVCDGNGDKVSLAAWFEETMSSDTIDVENDGGVRIQASYTAKSATGTVTLTSGRKLAFTIPKATGPAGAYVANKTVSGVEYIGRWVVLNDGETRGAVAVNNPSKRLIAPGPQTDLAPARHGPGVKVNVAGPGEMIAEYKIKWDAIP